MNVLTELFDTLATFSEYAPGVDANYTLDDLQSSGRTARKRVSGIISLPVYTAIATGDDDRLKDALRAAVASLTLQQQLVFDTINRRKSNIDLYKYEVEQMQRAYMESYFNAMDSLISLLTDTTPADDDDSPAALWRQSRYYRLLDACRLRTAEEFDVVYPIDCSYLFFFRTLPLQKETLDERLAAYYERPSNDRILNMLHLALAKKTVAKALRRFDILEFPDTIRNLFDDNTASRSGRDEHDAASQLADRLDAEADQLLETVDMLLDGTTTDYASYASHNREDDIIIMTP